MQSIKHRAEFSCSESTRTLTLDCRIVWDNFWATQSGNLWSLDFQGKPGSWPSANQVFYTLFRIVLFYDSSFATIKVEIRFTICETRALPICCLSSLLESIMGVWKSAIMVETLIFYQLFFESLRSLILHVIDSGLLS